MTRSPKPTPPHLSHLRSPFAKFDRTKLTPQKNRPKHKASTLESPQYNNNKNFRTLKPQGSFDGTSTTGALKETIESAEQIRLQKINEAKAYRQQILSHNKSVLDDKKKTDHTLHSPGYQKELQYGKDAKKIEKPVASSSTCDTEVIKKDTASFSQCIFNLANILMGVGLLGLPYACKSAGWILGTSILLFFSFVTWKTSILIGRELNGDPRAAHVFHESPFTSPLKPGSVAAQARLIPPMKSFPEIAHAAFGDKGQILFSIVLYFELFSCMAIFFVSLGDHLHILFPKFSFKKLVQLSAIVAIAPVILLRTARLLSYLSALGTFSTIVIVASIIGYVFVQGDITHQIAQDLHLTLDHLHTPIQVSGVPLTLGLVMYCFSGHAIVPSIYSSMERPQDFEKMVNVTYLIVTVSCVAVGLSGYYMFGDFVDDQVTITLEHTMSSSIGQLFTTGLTWLMVLTSFSKFVLTVFPLSLGFEEIVSPIISLQSTMFIVSIIIKMICIIGAYCVAVYVPSFSFLCSLVGLICTSIVSVIFPAMAHLRLFGAHLPWHEQVLDYIFIIGGILTAIIGTWATVRS